MCTQYDLCTCASLYLYLYLYLHNTHILIYVYVYIYTYIYIHVTMTFAQAYACVYVCAASCLTYTMKAPGIEQPSASDLVAPGPNSSVLKLWKESLALNPALRWNSRQWSLMGLIGELCPLVAPLRYRVKSAPSLRFGRARPRA